ncbi:MAG: 30S ribosome-binding factor RbfA [Anaerolineales bacterium]|nr:30S ribosome-binding factor RbfA [Anaerolineales bacterium]
MVSKLRLERIAERIRDDLAEILHQEVSDPRLDGIYITGVKVDRELTFADIHISALEGAERSKEILDGLKHASGYLRWSLAQRIELRTFPRLRFHWDSTAEKAARIEEIIASLQSEENQTGAPIENASDSIEEDDS